MKNLVADVGPSFEILDTVPAEVPPPVRPPPPDGAGVVSTTVAAEAVNVKLDLWSFEVGHSLSEDATAIIVWLPALFTVHVVFAEASSFTETLLPLLPARSTSAILFASCTISK